jgi:cytidylate kinase
MTRFDVLELASADYKRIYREEDADVGEPTKHIPGMLNREESKGRYGIWGHDIDDLVFEEVRIDTEKKTVRFGIGS